MSVQKQRKSNAERIASISDDKSEISAVFSDSVDPVKEIKYGKPIQAVYGLFVDYCRASSIHGVKYFGERKRHCTERIWWLFAFFLSTYGCGRLILNVYNKWDQSPVIVSFDEKSTPVWEIPFPAVTLCPETKVLASYLNYTDTYHIMWNQFNPPFNISDTSFQRMKAACHICDAHLVDTFNLNETLTDSTVIDTIKEIAPTFKGTMFACKWRNNERPCGDIFEEIMTEEGLCFTFNVLNSQQLYTDEISDDFAPIRHNRTAENWDPQDGYDKITPVDPEMYPYRVFGAGTRVGLFTLVTLYEHDLDYICRGPVQGFKILLHTPGEIPQVSKHYFRIPLNHEVLVSVKPNMMTTSEGLREYAPNRRQCFFQSERDLRFFRVYTQRNCELECLANFTLQICGCVKFSMPRDNYTPICGGSNIKCYNDAEDKLLEEQFKNGISNRDPTDGCNCLPACTSITYDAEISQAPLDATSTMNDSDSANAYSNPLDEFPGRQPSRLSIFFKETQFITSKRSELYGLTDFLANCGGLLGLFMGVSLLSIVEIFYFLTLRLICNLQSRQRRKRKLGKSASARIGPIPTIFIDHSDEKNGGKLN